MLKKFLKEVVVIVVGKQAEDITDLLDSKKHINEFVIAKKLAITINQTRNILYKISDHGLISSIRKKDKRKGWYTYFWKIEVFKCLEFLRNILLKKIEQISYQIKSRETKEFYVCKDCNIEFNEENALLHDFTCNECGKILTLKDNTKMLKEFRKNLDKLKRKLKFVNGEIRTEKEKIEKRRFKEIKKEKEEKARKRAVKKKSAKKKIVKKPVKKVSKKTKKVVKKPKKKLIKKKISGKSFKRKLPKKKSIKKTKSIKKKR